MKIQIKIFLACCTRWLWNTNISAEISANIILNKKNDFLIDNSTLNNISIKRIRNEIL